MDDFKKTDSVKDFVSAWPRRRVLAIDCAVTVQAVDKWTERDSIPVEHWGSVLDSAKKRGVSADIATLLRLAGLPDRHIDSSFAVFMTSHSAEVFSEKIRFSLKRHKNSLRGVS